MRSPGSAWDFPVAILAGGRGSRLRGAIGERQKVVAPVAGRPFLAHLLDQVAGFGFREVVLCVGYRSEEVEAELGSAHGPLRLRYSREETPLGTAGALRLALPWLEGTSVMVMNGDSFCDADLAAAWAWHLERAAEATVILVEVADTRGYGRVQVDSQGVIRRFEEKHDSAGAGWINAGIYLLARSRIAEIPSGVALSLERDVIPGWVDRGLLGWRSRAPFIDIGTGRSYAEAPRFFTSERTEGR